MKTYQIHVGSLVRAELSRQGKTITWLADQLGVQRTNCYRILYASSLHTVCLEQLSLILKHDFFADYTKQLCIPQNIERV